MEELFIRIILFKANVREIADTLNLLIYESKKKNVFKS